MDKMAAITLAYSLDCSCLLPHSPPIAHTDSPFFLSASQHSTIDTLVDLVTIFGGEEGGGWRQDSSRISRRKSRGIIMKKCRGGNTSIAIANTTQFHCILNTVL